MPIATSRNVRPARATDCAAVIELDPQADGRTGLLRRAIEEQRCFVVEACATSRALDGYVVIAFRRFFGRDFVELLLVHDDARRLGHGRALLRAAVIAAQTERVFSSTNESNAPMRALFAAEGWTFSGRLDGLDEGDPELVFFVDRPSLAPAPRRAR